MHIFPEILCFDRKYIKKSSYINGFIKKKDFHEKINSCMIIYILTATK